MRREFVDPFFKALGWDIDNEQGYAEAYKDVIHEDALKFGGSTKAPDYCFRIGGVRKYFVETKRPSVNLKLDPDGENRQRQLGRPRIAAKLIGGSWWSPSCNHRQNTDNIRGYRDQVARGA